jgi:hypothetical protein
MNTYIKQPPINLIMSLYLCLIQPILEARAEIGKKIVCLFGRIGDLKNDFLDFLTFNSKQN